MARRHEHFGLSYLEELHIVCERQNICKESRQEFLKFKQEVLSAPSPRPILKVEEASLEVIRPDSSPGPSSHSTPHLLQVPDYYSEWASSRRVRIFSVSDSTEESSPTPQKKVRKKKRFYGTSSEVTSSQEDEPRKVSVAIASVVGTTKKVTMLKKPECPAMAKYSSRKSVHARKRPSARKSQTEADQLGGKEPSPHKTPVRLRILTPEGTDSAAPVTPGKHPKLSEESLKPSLLSSVLELDETYSRRSSETSSIRSEYVLDSLGVSRTELSKVYERPFPQGRIYSHTSIQRMATAAHPRSIDEIIASLRSTAPTASDLKIKELLQSILGKDYNADLEMPSPLPGETEPKGETVTPILQPPAGKTETEPSDLETPPKEVTAEEAEQKEQDVSESAQAAQQEPPKVEEEDVVEVEAEDETAESPARKTASSATESSGVTSSSQEAVCVPFAGREKPQEAEAAPVEKFLKKKKKLPEGLQRPLFLGDLKVQGKAFPKSAPVEIPKSSEEPEEKQSLSLLSTWTPDIKDLDYPLIHHLCVASPRGVLPTNLHLASRVYHTSDKKGHQISLPPMKMPDVQSDLKEAFPATTAVEEQTLRERIYNEGLLASEVPQCSQKGGIHVLPSPSPESMPEWQRIAEFYVEKPRLELLGEKVQLQPASQKLFWTPAPQKFSVPLSVTKEALFAKYESNWIHGVICEDFSCDLREEEEELESEDDFDNLLLSIKMGQRCLSCPQIEAEEPKVDVFRESSAPQLTAFRDRSIFTLETDFKTAMEDMTVVKKHASAVMPPVTEEPSAKPQKPYFGPEKRPLTADAVVAADEVSGATDLVVKSKQDMFSVKEEAIQIITDPSALAEVSRQAGIKYIVFPKLTEGRKSKKTERYVTSERLILICKELNQPPRILQRSMSVGELPTFNKHRIKVSPAVRCYRSPSLPSFLDFEKFAERQGGIPEMLNIYTWTRGIWNDWFDELYPPSRPSSAEKEKSALDKKEKPPAEARELLLLEDQTDMVSEFQDEIDRITQQIEENPNCPFSYCRRGAIYRKTGRLKAAMEDLEKAISLEPKLVNAYWHRHLLFLHQERISPALDDLNFIIKNNKNHADAYLSRAAIFKRQGNLSLAIINYTLAMRLRPTDDEIYYRRGEIHEAVGDILMAMDDYAKHHPEQLRRHLMGKRHLWEIHRTIQSKFDMRRRKNCRNRSGLCLKRKIDLVCFYYNPGRTDALMKHGKYFFDKSTWNVAVSDFSTVIKEDPSHAEARTFRGRAYLKQGKFANAAEDFAAAIHLNPLDWIAYYHRGCILRTLDPKQALQDLSVSVLLNDNYENLGAFLHRGILYAELKQWTLAVCDFRSAIMLDRMITEAYVNIGLILLLHLDRHFESIEEFTHAIKVNPLDIRPYMCRAQAFQRIHDLKSAVRDINRAIHLQPNSPHLCLTRGQYLLQMKNYKLASFCIHQVAQIGEGSFECTLVQAALVHSFCQNHHKAIECAQEAARQQPDPAMFLLLGKVQMKAKKHKDAVASFKQALKILTGSARHVPSTFEAAELYYYMGQCYMEQVALLEAFDAFSTAVKLYPRYADAFYERGLCRTQLQQAGAILDFNKVLALAPKHYQAYLSRAAFYGSKGRFSKAIVNCTEALKIYPNSVRAFLYRGVLKFCNRTYNHAIEDLTKAITVDSLCVLAYYNRGITYHQLKDYKKALKDYGIVRLLEANKDIAMKVMVNRGILYSELNQHAFALEDFSDAALTQSKDSRLYKVIGVCLHRLQKYDEAVGAFSKVLKLDPFCLDGYIGRGNAYMEYGLEEATIRAKKDFLKALHLDPMCLKARLCLGYNLQALGKFQKAWSQFSAALQIDPNCHIAYDGRAVVCLQMGDTFAAFQDTNAALKIVTNAELLTNRGVINQFMGYLSCAMRDYQQAIAIDPGYALAYFNAANIYFFNRQFQQAYRYYSTSLVLDPKNESAFLNRAITNTLLKNFEEAKADFEAAVSLSPFSAAIYFNKANLYNTLENYEQAEKDISKALSIQPYDALMHKLRADIRGKMGLLKEAVADYKNAISIQELICSE